MNSACEGPESWSAERRCSRRRSRPAGAVEDVLSREPDRPAGISSWSLAKAMLEPQNETEPTTMREQDRDHDVERDVAADRQPVAELRPCDQRHGAASDAVVEGDHLRHRVIWTRRDATTPMSPTAIPIAIRPQLPTTSRNSVTATATAMPAAAIRLPRLRRGRMRALADADDEQREGDDVEQRDEVAARVEHGGGGHSASLRRLVLGLRPRLADEHSEHPVGDHEPADDVDRPEGDRDRADHLVERVVGEADDDQAAEHDDAVDRVRLRHQRRVQRRRHLRDHLEADEGGEHEDRDLGDQVITSPTRRSRRVRS